jgi:hypothetical protein
MKELGKKLGAAVGPPRSIHYSVLKIAKTMSLYSASHSLRG